MCICDTCNRGFPEGVMYTYSPGGFKKIHECPECHDRGANSVDIRQKIKSNRMKKISQELAL